MSGVKAVVFPAAAVVCVIAFVYLAAGLRYRRRDVALVSLLIAFACKAISFTLSTPSVSEAVDRLLGVPNLAALGIHLFGGVGSSTAILTALVFWGYPRERAVRRARVQVLCAAVLTLAMVVLWWIAGYGMDGRSAHYLLSNAHRPLVAAYLLLYVTAFAVGLVEIARLGWRFAPVAGLPWLRRGLRTVTLGAVIYLVYCSNRLWVTVAVQLGLDPLTWELLTPVCTGLGILFLTVGLTMPSWGPSLGRLMRWAQQYRAHVRLYPLWRDLCRTVPDIALDPPTSLLVDRLTVTDLHYRLYRRVIEIRDGSLALRPYLPTGSESSSTDPAGEARRLRDAMRAKEASVPSGSVAASSVATHHSQSYLDEVAWLVRVSGEYRRIRRGGSAGSAPVSDVGDRDSSVA